AQAALSALSLHDALPIFPEDPAEAFEFAAQSFDLAERLQTMIFVMLDLDIGMNHRLCRPLKWDDARQYDRGKVMTAEMLDEPGRDRKSTRLNSSHRTISY